MKKLILALSLLLSATTSVFGANQVIQGVVQPQQLQSHIPATGPIQLHDTTTQQGIIIDIILNDLNFQEERDTITNFSQNIQNPNYQNIVTFIKNAAGCIEGGLEVLEAFERAIMHYIHQKNYIITFENKWLNIFVTGVRWSWITPADWTHGWHKEKSFMVHQCMNELSSLANIAKKYSTISSTRMKATVESYINWRANTLVTIGTYLLVNGILRHDTQKSPLTMLINGGLKNTPNAIGQVKNDIVDFTTTVGNYIMPVGNRIFNGRNVSDQVTNHDTNKITATTTSQAVTANTASNKENNSKRSTYSYLKDEIKKYNKTFCDKFFDESVTIQSKKIDLPKVPKEITANNKKIANRQETQYLIDSYKSQKRHEERHEKIEEKINPVKPMNPFDIL